MTEDERGLVGGQERRPGGRLLRGAHAAGYRGRAEIGLRLFGRPGAILERGIDETGADRVDTDALPEPFDRRRFGQRGDRVFAGNIKRGLGKADDTAHGSVVDDGSGALARHRLGLLHPGPENAADIGIEDGVIDIARMVQTVDNEGRPPVYRYGLGGAMSIGYGQPASGISAVASAAAVGNEFLEFGRLEPTVPPIDQMKLQKLLFYAHAWHLALKDAPLFDEDFEAWPWGPVVRDVYFQTKDYGRSPVTRQLTEIRRTGPNPLDFTFVPTRVTDDKVRDFIRQVWDVHKLYTGIRLSNATHAPGEPWTIIRDHYGHLDHKPVIPNHIIQDIFKRKAVYENTAAE